MKCMKQFFFLAALTSLFFAVASCSKDDQPVDPYGKVEVSFTNMVGSEALTMGPIRYVNANGDQYSVDLLKYYVSHFTLVRDDSTEVESKGHELIDNAEPASMRFTLDSIPNGRYIAMRFYIGVDYDHNHSGDQSGDLDPIHGMIWTWNTGYIFFKHEGSYKDAAQATQPLFFHLGTDRGLSTVRQPIPSFEVAGNDRKLKVRLDLNKVYGGPNVINFQTDNNRMSTGADDGFWISAMQSNLSGAFSYGSAE